MPAQRLRRSERRAVVVEELLEAATEVFAAKGYAAASVAEIAASAGYTVGALYSNFSGKRALFEAVLERERRLQFQRAGAVLGEGGDLTQVSRRLLELDQRERRGWLLWIESVMEALRSGERPPPVYDAERESRQQLRNMLASLVPDVSHHETLANALLALWRGWLLSAAAVGHDDAESLARAMRWLVTGAVEEEGRG
jgi:AcrR family transcriptional regulator